MTAHHHDPHTTIGNGDVDFTAVARLLDDAAVLVRTRGEHGEPPAHDHRPRIRDAIARAADLVHAGAATAVVAGRPRTSGQHRGGQAVNRTAGVEGDRCQQVRDWAIVLAAMEINAALGRGRYRDGRDLAASARTLAGFGLDVGTLGAVNAAADLLAQAARTARHIAAAGPVPVHRYGDVVAYPLGAVLPAALDIDDIITAEHPSAPPPDTTAGNLRVLRIHTAADGTRRFLLDTASGPLSWPDDQAGMAPRIPAWRPVPHRCHPWQVR